MHRKLNDITDKPSSIDDLAKFYKLPQSEEDSAIDKAYTIALLFLKLKAKLNIK